MRLRIARLRTEELADKTAALSETLKGLARGTDRNGGTAQ
jgi:hypothetical protein